MNKICCVYKITSPSGKIYIGSTIDFKKRIKHYRLGDCKAQTKLYNSFLKYGFINHKIEILEECAIDSMYEKERIYGDSYEVMSNNGLNLSLPGYGTVSALISDETREKMKKSQTKEKNNFYGRKHTEESLAKMRAAHLNKSKETLQRMREAQLGRKASPEAKLKMSISQKGRTHSDQTKIKMRDSCKKTKLVLCIYTGIFYNGTKEAALSIGIDHRNLSKKLLGIRKNDTRFIYA